VRWRGTAGIALLLAFVAGLALAWALWPPSGEDSRGLGFGVSAVCACAALAGWAQRRVLSDRPAMVLGWVAAFALSMLVASRETAESQVTFAVGFVVLGALLGGVLAPALLTVHLFVLAAVLTFALDTSPSAASLQVGMALASAMVALAVLVHLLVRRTIRLMSELRAAALTDPLTGALNRRGVAVEARAVHAAMERWPDSVSTVVVLDVDRFKEYNDLRGHSAGDALLAELVRGWRRHVREGDIVARMGGDEFALLLVGADLMQASHVLDRLATGASAPCSYGLARWEAGEPLDSALLRADRDLYRHKSRSRRARERVG
jgi:diguanylate cyclase (GGDEF)-like protein